MIETPERPKSLTKVVPAEWSALSRTPKQNKESSFSLLYSKVEVRILYNGPNNIFFLLA